VQGTGYVLHGIARRMRQMAEQARGIAESVRGTARHAQKQAGSASPKASHLQEKSGYGDGVGEIAFTPGGGGHCLHERRNQP
jgi:hypothetical protein